MGGRAEEIATYLNVFSIPLTHTHTPEEEACHVHVHNNAANGQWIDDEVEIC